MHTLYIPAHREHSLWLRTYEGVREQRCHGLCSLPVTTSPCSGKAPLAQRRMHWQRRFHLAGSILSVGFVGSDIPQCAPDDGFKVLYNL